MLFTLAEKISHIDLLDDQICMEMDDLFPLSIRIYHSSHVCLAMIEILLESALSIYQLFGLMKLLSIQKVTKYLNCPSILFCVRMDHMQVDN